VVDSKLSLQVATMAEDAPNAAGKGSQPVNPKGSTDATSAVATSANAAEVLLPLLSIRLPSQGMHDIMVLRLVQTLAAPSVLS
jgi:hypothetical protein